MKSYALINGTVPVLSSGPVTWRLRAGTEPVTETFDIPPQAVDVLRAAADKPCTLEIGGGAESVKFEQLWIQEFPPGPNPHIARVRLADRRWFWPRTHVLRRYNMRRSGGNKTVAEQPNALFTQIVNTVDINYAAYSISPYIGGPWTVADMLSDLVEQAAAAETEFTGVRPVIRFSDDFLAAAGRFPLENIEIDDPGDQAVARGLAHLPEARVLVAADGTILLYSAATGNEKEIIADLGPELVSRGHISKVDNSVLRARAVDVLFTREIEVRFDFVETSDVGVLAPQAVAAGLNIGTGRVLENVLPVPDQSLTVVNRSRKPVKVCQGVWITMEQAMQAWNKLPLTQIGPLTHGIIQTTAVPFNDLWAAMRFVGRLTPGLADWESRIAAVKTHWRRTFRINREWVDRYIAVRPYRVATLDQTSGQRAPAPVFMSWCALSSVRTFINRATDEEAYALNVYGWPPQGGAITADTKFAPALLSILDADQGIIQLDMQHDPFRHYEMCMPGNILQDMPRGAIRYADVTPVCWNARAYGRKQLPKFAPGHRMTIILTLIPAAPNSDRQLHRIRIYPRDVADMLPLAAREGLEAAKGPVQEIRIGATVETARTAWNDADARDIERMFGFHADQDEDISDRVRHLVVNEGAGVNAIGAGSLRAMALAHAAKYYAGMADRQEGTAAGAMRPLAPAGWCDEIVFSLDPSGTAICAVSLPEKSAINLSIFGLMDDKTRAVILRQVQ